MTMTEFVVAIGLGALATWTVIRVGLPQLWTDIKNAYSWVRSKV